MNEGNAEQKAEIEHDINTEQEASEEEKHRRTKREIVKPRYLKDYSTK